MVFAVFVELAGCAVQGEQYVFACFVACGFGCFDDQLQRFFVAVQVRCETAFVADGSWKAFAVTQFFQCVENFGAATQGFAERFCADGHNHEFLDVQAVVGMFAAVDNVHHWNRQSHWACATQVTIQRQACIFSGCACYGHRNGQGGVGTQVTFVFRTVQFDHDLVDIRLFVGIDTDEGLRDLVVDVVNGFQYAFAQVTGFVAVTQFQSFFLAG